MHWVLLGMALQGAVRISGAGQCPSPQTVLERMERIAPGGASPKLSARLTEGPQALTVELLDERGAPQDARTFPRAPCDALAETVAVHLASWLAAPPEALLPAAPPKPPPKPAAPATPFDSSVGAGLTVNVTDPQSLGVRLWVAVAPWRLPLRLRGGLGLLGWHALPMGDGLVVHWQRFSAQGGIEGVLRLDGWTLGLGVDGHAALLGVFGDPQGGGPETTHTFNLGASGTLFATSPQGLWLGLGLYVWPRHQVVLPAGPVGNLPQTELLFCLGWVFSDG